MMETLINLIQEQASLYVPCPSQYKIWQDTEQFSSNINSNGKHVLRFVMPFCYLLIFLQGLTSSRCKQEKATGSYVKKRNRNLCDGFDNFSLINAPG